MSYKYKYIYIYVCIYLNVYRKERVAASAIITENNEQQATSEGWGQTNRNTIVSQRKEGKHAQRKHLTQPFSNQWGIRSKPYQKQWRR